MTLRQMIARQKRRLSIVTYGGFAVFAAGLALGAGTQTLFAVTLPGFAIFMAGVASQLLFIRCPSCRERIGRTLSYGSPFSLSPSIRYCPSCGVDLDSELGEKK
jgi:hypothetical protein